MSNFFDDASVCYGDAVNLGGGGRLDRLIERGMGCHMGKAQQNFDLSDLEKNLAALAAEPM